MQRRHIQRVQRQRRLFHQRLRFHLHHQLLLYLLASFHHLL
jgi:hypothetical protein